MTPQLFDQAELAGMVSESGQMGGEQFLWAASPPPNLWHVRLNGDRLEWWHDASDPPTRYTSPKGMLDAFVRIQTPEDVLRFAQRYGTLWICKHGLPATHNSPHVMAYPWLNVPPMGQRPWCEPLGLESAQWSPEQGWHGEVFWAPLSVWFDLVRSAKAILNLAAALHQGKRGTVEDWMTVLRQFGSDEAMRPVAEVVAGMREPWDDKTRSCIARETSGRPYLALVISRWLYMGNVQPQLVWDVDEPAIRLLAGNPVCVYGPLGVQLMVAVNRGHDIAVCSGCGDLYLREGRKPQAGRLNFCPKCSGKAANRMRQRVWRASPEGQRKLAERKAEKKAKQKGGKP